jgi:hypothetical protein
VLWIWSLYMNCPIGLSVRPSISISVCMSVRSSVLLIIHSSVCLSNQSVSSLSVRPFCVSVCLSVLPSFCPTLCLSNPIHPINHLFVEVYYRSQYPRSTVVMPLTHNTKIKGLNPATGTGREQMAKWTERMYSWFSVKHGLNLWKSLSFIRLFRPNLIFKAYPPCAPLKYICSFFLVS